MPNRGIIEGLPEELRPAPSRHGGGRPRRYPKGQSPEDLVKAANAEAKAEAAKRIKAKRRIRLEPEMIENVVKLIWEGNYAHIAARSIGIHEATFRDWMDRGETQWLMEATDDWDPDGLCAELYERVTEAEAAWEVATVADLEHKIQGNSAMWAARMTQLERRDPHRWGRRDTRGEGSQSWEAQVRKLSKQLAARGK